jgi:hypothetical protein
MKTNLIGHSTTYCCLLFCAFLLLGCGSKELSTPLATKLIKEHYQFPMPEYAEFPLIQGGIYHYPIRKELVKYQNAGLITFREENQNFGAKKFTIGLTEEGYQDVLEDNGNEVVIKKAEWEFGEITGIISSVEQKLATVQYTIRRVNITAWGEILGVQEETKDGEDEFLLYDDGWRIMSDYEPRIFSPPSKKSFEKSSSASNSERIDEPGGSENIPSNNEQNPGKFKGAWFEVAIPDGFKAISSLKSTTADGYESAFFRSPDEKVEFYIFSPQWNGEPTDIKLDESKEKPITSETKSSGSNDITWYSIKANDNSYTRAYQDTKSKDGSIRWVVGIKYADQQSYDKYKTQYLDFKKSLVQFAD